MSLRTQRPLRAFAGLALATGTALAVAAPAQSATDSASATASATATCQFPIVGAQQVTFDAVFPTGLVAGDSAPALQVRNLRFPQAVNELADTVELVSGSTLFAAIEGPNFASNSVGVLLRGELPIERDIAGGMFSFMRPGGHTGTVQGLQLNMKATDATGAPIPVPATGYDSDGDPSTFNAFCSIQGTPTATFTVASANPDDATPPSAPTAITLSSVTPTVATVNWAASSDDSGIDRYKVDLVGPAGSPAIPSVQVADLQAPFTGLRPDTPYTVTVRAIDTEGNVSEPGTATFRTPKVTAPKISNYAVNGSFTILVEPSPGPGELRLACITSQPSISFLASGFDTIVGGTKLYFQGLWQTKFGVPSLFTGGLVRYSDDGVTFLRDGAIAVDAADALGFYGAKGSMIVADRSALPSSGRVNVLAWYPVRTKWFGVNVVVPTFLPSKSVSFRFVDKPAGACANVPAAFYLEA
ncbi:MAG: fibronectin type III domain-containing protein [Solirubrobacteraceae bacterium]|nr:fibronectin type III domain-containing protein [Solirubrobacteraceae bacterium]